MNNVNDVMDALVTHTRRLDVVMKKRRGLHSETSMYLNAIRAGLIEHNLTETEGMIAQHQVALIDNDEELLEVIASILEDLKKIDENHQYVTSLLLEKVEE